MKFDRKETEYLVLAVISFAAYILVEAMIFLLLGNIYSEPLLGYLLRASPGFVPLVFFLYFLNKTIRHHTSHS